jgi:hypothetical protein
VAAALYTSFTTIAAIGNDPVYDIDGVVQYIVDHWEEDEEKIPQLESDSDYSISSDNDEEEEGEEEEIYEVFPPQVIRDHDAAIALQVMVDEDCEAWSPPILPPLGPPPAAAVLPPRVFIDLTHDEVAVFDRDPLIMAPGLHMHGYFECAYCRLRWHHVRDLRKHLAGPRHRKMVDFIRGRPMFYCLTCNLVPGAAKLHLQGARHLKAVRKMRCRQFPTDFAFRQVVRNVEGRLEALLVFPPL